MRKPRKPLPWFVEVYEPGSGFRDEQRGQYVERIICAAQRTIDCRTKAEAEAVAKRERDAGNHTDIRKLVNIRLETDPQWPFESWWDYDVQ